MKEITQSKSVQTYVDKEVTGYFIEATGTIWDRKEDAEFHESLSAQYPEIDPYIIESIMGLISEDMPESMKDDGRHSVLHALEGDEAIVLISDSDSYGSRAYETFEPTISAVRSIIKVLHRKCIGMGCNQYVDGIIYKGKSYKFIEDKGKIEVPDWKDA